MTDWRDEYRRETIIGLLVFAGLIAIGWGGIALLILFGEPK